MYGSLANQQDLIQAGTKSALFANEKFLELQHYANEGHWSWKVLGCIVCGGLVLDGIINIFSSFLSFNLYQLLLFVFTTAFGIIGLALESKVNMFTNSGLMYLKREAHFLFRPWGRALYYFFIGLFLLTQSGPMVYVLGIGCCVVGIILYYSSVVAVRSLNALHSTHFTIGMYSMLYILWNVVGCILQTYM